MFQDVIVSGREALLNLLLGVRSDVLNTGATGGEPTEGANDMARELKRTVNRFKSVAFEAEGRRVDYRRLQVDEAYTAYRRLTRGLRALDLTTFSDRTQRLSFWINLYNALVIDAVIAFGVQRTVKEGWLGVMRFFRRAAYTVGGCRFSCEDIEHGILRANRGNPSLPGPHFRSDDPRCAFIISPPDPRFHFTLNCASRSCPPVGVYEAEHLDAQLDLAARNFIGSETEVSSEQGTVSLSSLLKWYAEDFGGREGVLDFVLRYLPEDEARAWLADRRADVELTYHRYDWSLNA